jgi:tetratricopeptide (TPR) repeat protein
MVDTTRSVTKESVFARLKNFLKELFRSEEEKEAQRHLEAGFDLGRYGFEAALDDHEEAVRLRPSDVNRSILATTYLGAGDERLGLMTFGGPIYQLTSWTSGEVKAKEILSWVSKVRQLEGKEFGRYSEAYEGLNKALDGALEMYDNACRTDSTHPTAYQRRARAFHLVADGILMAQGIFPVRFSKHSADQPKGEPIQYGNAQLGICIRKEMPDLDFLVEIMWLYEHAVEDYQTALRLDPTDTESYVGLAHVQQKLGKGEEATNNLNKALAILNRAIQADNTDERSYSKRAQIFEELGEIELAISDLERLLTLSKCEFELDATRQKIEKLRKRKEGTREE